MRSFKYYSNDLLLATLKQAKSEDVKPIFEHLDLTYSASVPIKTVVIRISQTGGNSFTNLFKDGDTVGYLRIVVSVAKALGISAEGLDRYLNADNQENSNPALVAGLKHEISGVIYDIEGKIIEVIAGKLYQKLNAEQRKAFDTEVRRVASQRSDDPSRSIIGAGGALLIGNLGGFGTYMLMSSLLSTLSLGTLGFGAYTFASSALSVVLGPAGWAALGAYAIFKLNNPSLTKLVPIVIAVALIRRKYSR